MSISRRSFLQLGSLATASLLVPQFLKGFERRALSGNKILVVVQLGGGNDGLNTIIPVRNDVYYRSRPTIAIPRQQALAISDDLALHPSLSGIRKLFDEGAAAVINGVGYPEPNRSHFESMKIWHKGHRSDRPMDTGWLGRYMDQAKGNMPNIMGVEIADNLSEALHGEKTHAVAFRDLERFHRAATDPFLNSWTHAGEHHDDMVAYMYTSLRDYRAAADYIYSQTKKYSSTRTYPNTLLGKDLKMIGSLINSGSDKKIYYAQHNGFDTHVQQTGKQTKLLQQLDEALNSFTSDLKHQSRFQDVVILVFSEFGRRVAENASKGTDHGAASSVLIIGGGIKTPGIYNEFPDLSVLDRGDVRFTTDFRDIYATILERWLQTPSSAVLGDKFKMLNLL